MTTGNVRKYFIGILLLPLVFAACSHSNSPNAGAESQVVPPGVTMSPKPPMFGVVLASNIVRSFGVVSGIDTNANASTRAAYSNNVNNFSKGGGYHTVPSLKAMVDFAAAVAIEKIKADAAANNPGATGRWVRIPLGYGFTGPTGANEWTDQIIDAVDSDLVQNITGHAATADQLKAMSDMAKAERALATDTPDGKQFVVELLAVTVLLGENSWVH